MSVSAAACKKMELLKRLALPLLFLSKATASCTSSLRLLHEVSGLASTASLRTAGGAAIALNVSQGSTSDYTDVPCDESLSLVDDSSGTELFAVPAPGTPRAAGSRATVFAVGDASGQSPDAPSAALFDDATQLVADGASNIDIAAVRVCNALRGVPGVTLMGVTAECYKCKRPQLTDKAVPYGSCSSYSLSLDTTWAWNLGVADEEGLQASTTPAHFLFLEHGQYSIVVRNAPFSLDASSLLRVVADVEGQNAYLPILYAFLSLVALLAVYHAGVFVAVRYLAVGSDAAQIAAGAKARAKAGGALTLISFFGVDSALAAYLARQKRIEEQAAGSLAEGFLGGAKSLNGAASVSVADGETSVDGAGGAASAGAKRPSTRPLTSARILSIDTFRGISLSIMIFVNSGGGQYDAFFDHSRWNGLTVADLVFPWFVWTQGVSMAISFASERKRGATQQQLAIKTITRSAKLYALGLFLNNGHYLSEWRLIGVLPYFSISYLVVGLLESFLSPVSGVDGETDEQTALPASIGALLRLEVLRYWAQWSVMLTLGLIYILVQAYLPVPGCPTGYIGAGGLADGGLYPSCTGGAHRRVDELLLGLRHIYHDLRDNGQEVVSSATCSEVYQCAVFDPEGALGFISAAWMAWLGLQAGRVFTKHRHLASGPGGAKATLSPFVQRWLAWGSICLLLASALCGFSKEDGLIPINKNLWSPSFVLLLAGLAFCNLSALYTVVDVFRLWEGAPFRFVGSNSIATYAGSETFSDSFPFAVALLQTGAVNHAEALASNMIGVIAWLAFARALFVMGIFIVV